MEDKKNYKLGLLLKESIQKKALSMRRLSELTGIDTATISRIINGKRNANLHHLQCFSEHLAVPIGQLLASCGYPIEDPLKKQQKDIHTSIDMIEDFLKTSDEYDQTFSIKHVEKLLVDYEQIAQSADGSDVIIENFDEKIKSLGSVGPFITQLKGLFKKFRSENLSGYEFALIGSALLYFIVPTDVIPDTIFPIGYLDDAIAVKLVVNALTNKGMPLEL